MDLPQEGEKLNNLLILPMANWPATPLLYYNEGVVESDCFWVETQI